MLHQRNRGVAGTIGDSIFLAVGDNSATSRFQPNSTPLWTSSPLFDDFPLGQRFHSASAVVEGKLFVMGGQAPDSSTTDEVWSFDPSRSPGSNPSNQWNRLSAMPGPRFGACAASFQRKIYLFSGVDEFSSSTNTIFVFDPFDPASDGMGSWKALDGVNLPLSIAYCAAAQEREFIYIFGRFPASLSGIDTIVRFRPDENGGEGVIDSFSGPDDPPVLETPRFQHTATSISGKIVVAGGIGPRLSILRSAEMFDPSSNTVSSLPDLNFSRHSHQASTLDSTLFVFGGEGSTQARTSVESLFLPA